MDTLGELAAALQENKEVVDILNEAIVVKADKEYVDGLVANIPTESQIFVIDCPDGSVISHTFEQIMAAKNENKAVYASIYGTNIMPLTYISDDNSFIEFSAIRGEMTNGQYTTVWVDGLVVNSDNSFTVKHGDLLGSMSISEDELDSLASMLI